MNINSHVPLSKHNLSDSPSAFFLPSLLPPIVNTFTLSRHDLNNSNPFPYISSLLSSCFFHPDPRVHYTNHSLVLFPDSIQLNKSYIFDKQITPQTNKDNFYITSLFCYNLVFLLSFTEYFTISVILQSVYVLKLMTIWLLPFRIGLSSIITYLRRHRFSPIAPSKASPCLCSLILPISYQVKRTNSAVPQANIH